MTFADLVAGDALFVDANTLVYHFQPHPVFGPPCSQLLQRIENQELAGFTSTHVLGEVTHRLMTMEAHVLFGWPFAGIGNHLRNHPTDVCKLSAFRQAIDTLALDEIHLATPVFPA